MPQFTSADKVTAGFYEDWRVNAAYVLMALVAIHIVAALYHRLISRDVVVSRMLSGG